MNRINLYLFNQIIKSCTLVFFIFISIAWLLQLSRLFNVMSHLRINSLEILYLSLLMVPNLISIVLPFLIIFGLVLSFFKLSRDKELIAIYCLGLSIKEIKKPIIFLIILFTFISFFLSFFLSPKTYAVYKESEFNLRNTIQFDKIDFSNFIKFSKDLIIDYENNDGEFEKILINIIGENETIIYGNKGEINQTNEKINFKLFDGFKTEIKKDSVENLNFDSYTASFPLDKKKIYKKNDPNALDLFELLKSKIEHKNIIIYLRCIDILLIISLALFFYINNIKKNKFNLPNQLIFISVALYLLVIDNLLESFIFNNNEYIFLLIINLIIIQFYPLILKTLKIKND